MLYSVSFLSSSSQTWQVSRFFSTVRAARKWSTWLAGQAAVAQTAIHRGGPGGEVVA